MSTPGAVRAGAALVWALVSIAHPGTSAAIASSESPAAVSPETLDASPRDFALRRAAAEHALGNPQGVIENLEPVDFSGGPAFEGADRAAFLLGQAYLRLGALERFTTLANDVAGWPGRSHFTRWLIYQRMLLASRGGADLSLADLASQGWSTDLSGADTSTALGRDLAGRMRIRRATEALENGDDPTPWLEAVPSGSPHSGRARHMLGLYALERGDTTNARRLLEALANDPSYAGRREAALAVAGLELERARWDAAHRAYAVIEQDLDAERDTLSAWLDGDDHASLWASWQSVTDHGDVVLLDAGPARALAHALADRASDLGDRSGEEAPLLDAPDRRRALPWRVEPPSEDDWRALAESEAQVAEAAYALDRTRAAMADEAERLAERRRYLGLGDDRLRTERRLLGERAALLDSLQGVLDLLDVRLRAARDTATRRVLERTSAILEDAAGSLLWLSAMRRFHLDGPERTRAVPPPSGYPGEDEVVSSEEALARAVRDLVERLAAEWPALIDRSHESAWRPGVIERARDLNVEARRQLAWASRIGAALDSTLAAAFTSDTLEALMARASALSGAVDSLVAAHDALRATIARQAIQRTLGRIEEEREAIDYGLAASAYGLAVGLDPLAGSGMAENDDAGVDSTTSPSGWTPGTPASVAWRKTAIEHMETFLARYPESFARGETRFRLADLLHIDAREDFEQQMARYLEDRETGGSGSPGLPLLSHEPVLVLYRAILEEDLDFPHRDAVLFNAGMLLLDQADSSALAYFDQLVQQHPESDYCQEAYVRMGDMHFAARRYAECIRLYRHAAEGRDPSLTTIALYKMGWAHFNEDHFDEATQAFGRVLDLYASARRDEIEADVETEAEDYLIHSLARAGGARAFAEYFDRTAGRPYERRILMAMGQHFRRFSLYDDAAATDQMYIERYPDDPDALTSARRLVETYQRWDQPDRLREARLANAPRFAPSGSWYQAQDSDSLRAAGAEFARSSWLAVAVHHHRRAREESRPDDWREALRLYEMVISHWPDDAETPAFHLYAGEAGVHLEQPAEALAHYRVAADAGSDSVAEIALRQRVAVTDAWYEKTRVRATGGATGSDSLAREVLTAGDELIARFPQHEGGADVLWRMGNLAFAHGWSERAAADFGRLAASHPGDARTPMAASLRADALFRIEAFDRAGAAFEEALAIARAAGRDSLAARAATSIPICYYRHAQSVAIDDSTNFERQAALFQEVATRWPAYEHAHLAQYRAGLAYLAAGRSEDGILAMRSLIDRFPASEYVRDARLEVARAWEARGERVKASDAYVEFAERHPDDETAGDAWLKAADLGEAAGMDARAESLRLTYIRLYPDDHETAMTILEPLARRDLAGVESGQPLSSMLEPSGVAADSLTDPSHLWSYLKRAADHPELAHPGLLAEVRFRQGEEALAAYNGTRLGQPLDQSIPIKQRRLDEAMTRYRESAEFGVPLWAHASSFRIGEALVAFGKALEDSERPADLSGDDLFAYEDVLFQQAQGFYDRGEGVWEDLLRQKGDGKDDEWLKRTRTTLWKRLAYRFYFRPEVEFPLVEGVAPGSGASPGRGRPPAGKAAAPTRPSASGADTTAPVARREGETR